MLVALPLVRHGVFLFTMVALVVTTAGIIGRPSSRYSFYALQFFVDMYAICTLLCFLPARIRRVLKCLMYATAYVLAITETFLFFRFNLNFSPTMLNLLMETNTGEASEFVTGCLHSTDFWRTLTIYGTILAINVFAARWGYLTWKGICRLLRVHRHERMRQLGFALRFVLVPAIALTGLSVGLMPWIREKRQIAEFLSNEHSRSAEHVSMHVFYTPFYRLLYSAHFLHIARMETERLIHRMDRLCVDSCAATCPNIVLIIGESYNKHHAQIYGYPAETTPHLARMARRGTLQVFTDVISPWNVTSQCFKSFLSTHSADQPGNWTDGVLFPCLFRRSGYKVAFVTQQFYRSASQGAIDFNGSFFLNDARTDSLCFDYRNARPIRPEASIPQLLTGFTPGRNNLYILHLYGQHMEYARRYPAGQAHFTPDDVQRPDLTAAQRAIVAHYDNATRYNDEVIARIFQHFRQQDALILYFSDHGEEVYDEDVGIYGRNHAPRPSAQILRGEYEIPFMMWGTPTFRRKHPALWQRIRAARQRPFSHDDLPHLLLGLAGIHTSYYQPERDLLHPDFRPQRRMVKDVVDYDLQRAQP